MGNKDWQRLDSKDDLSAIGISPNRGRGWRIVSGILFIFALTFALAYYLPLYRAHASLSREFRTLSGQAVTQHKQLSDTLDALKLISADRDRLNTIAATMQKTSDALTPEAESLERDLTTALKKFLGTGKLQLVRHKEKLQITLASPALLPLAGADLTDTGKKSLCAVGGVLKTADVHVVIQGHASASTPKSAAWKLAAARAGAAAQLLSETCGVDSSRVELSVRDPSHGSEGAALTLEITPL